jgi:multidrug resistance efflux pump
VSGTISKLYTDFNSRVKRGEVLAQLDPSLFAGAVLQAKADLANAQANAAAAKANPAKARCHRADRRRLRPQCRTGQGKRLEAVATNGPEVTQKFAETRRPEAFRRAAVEAGLSSFEVISNDGLGPDEPFTGVGTWLQFSKEATAWPVTELRV